MKVFVTHRNGTRFDVAEAVAASCTYEVSTSEGDDECDQLRRRLDSTAETLGKVLAFLIKGDQSDEAKETLLAEVLAYRMTVQHVARVETIG